MDLEKILENYGLEEKQARVYLACLELGSATAYKLAQKTSLPRSTCYEITRVLQDKALISVFYKNKVKYFAAEDPRKTIDTAKEKIEQFEKALPRFNAVFNVAKEKPKVRFYEGAAGMKTILKEILGEAEELSGFSSSEDLILILGDYWPDFIKQRVKKKIHVRTLLRDSEKARERLVTGPQELRTVKIIPAQYEHHGLTFIWTGKIAMFSFGKETNALVIESKELSQMQKAMFDLIWDSAR